MPYVDSFTYDIFLSYAHSDDVTSPTRPRGWVTIFREELKAVLNYRLGGEVSIWWDTANLRGNQVVVPAIQAAVKQSAVLLVLLSESYLESKFCTDEIGWFCGKVTDKSPGLVLDTHDSRIFNVLQYNIPRTEWPSQLNGLVGHEFYTKSSRDGLGQPLRFAGLTEDAQRHADEVIAKLADEIIGVLKALKKLKAPAAPAQPSLAAAPSERLTVYLADVHGGLAPNLERLRQELQANHIDALGPAPTAELAQSLIARSQASVHLLNHISDASAEAQIELGKCAPSQIIWLSGLVKIPEHGRTAYQETLFALKNHIATNGNFEFMHGGDHWISDIVGALAARKRLLQQRHDPDALYIDVTYNETLASPELQELYDFLVDRQIQFEATRHYPQQQITDDLAKNIQRAKAVVFFYGKAPRALVQDRFKLFLKEIAKDDTLWSRIEYIGIYAAPPPEKPHDSIERPKNYDVDWIDRTNFFAPAMLSKLMAHFSSEPAL